MDQLPLWFLLLSLMLPRICLLIGYFSEISLIANFTGWVSPTLAILIPRALILILIFRDRGMSPWLLLDALMMASAYSGGKKILEENY
jgi:hypothetical protein